MNASLETDVTDWTGARERLGDGWHWHYADLTGAVFGESLPTEQPEATHVWGHRPGEWARLRCDGGTVWLGILRDTEDGDVEAESIDPLPRAGLRVSTLRVRTAGNAGLDFHAWGSDVDADE